MLSDTLEKVKGLVAGTRGGQGGAAGFLKPIDTERVARDLSLARRARENGAGELPRSDTSELDDVEQSIVQRIESEWRWHGGELINHLRAYATRLQSYSIEAELRRLLLKSDNSLITLRAAHHVAEQSLHHLKVSFVETRKEHEAFRQKHRLARPVRNQGGRWTSAGLLIFLIAVEALLNGVFFAKGSELGLLGGVGTAIGISLANVVFAFLLGLGPARWLNHRVWLVKIVGFVLLTIAVPLLVGLHAFAAHMREATALAGQAVDVRTVLTAVTTTPLQLSDLNSYYLFALGCLFALVSLWKGYVFDDPYPGFGRQHRRYEAARLAYSEDHAGLFADLEEIKESTVEELDAGMERLPRYPQQAAAIRTERLALVQQFRNYEGAIETAINQLLATYRNENQKCRSTPPPGHFSKRWMLPRSWLEETALQTAIADPAEPERDISQVLGSLSEASKAVLSEYEDLIAKYPHATTIDRAP